MLREITSHPSQKLYGDATIHLLCANYWLLPIYQELLHTATRYNVTSESERKRPCSGLAKILAHPKPVKTQAKRQNAHTKTVSDWIGGLCDADSLYVWFPAHWVPHLLMRLEAREDEFRQKHLLWFDRELPDDELLEDQKKAKAGRKLQFGMRPYDGGNVRQLTGSIRADWLSLPLNSFRQQLQHVRKGVVFFRPKWLHHGQRPVLHGCKSPFFSRMAPPSTSGMRRRLACHCHGRKSLR